MKTPVESIEASIITSLKDLERKAQLEAYEDVLEALKQTDDVWPYVLAQVKARRAGIL